MLSTFDLDEVLHRILGIARSYFDLRNVAILLLDKETRQLSVRSQVGWDTGADGISLGVQQGITGAAVTGKQPVYVPDVRRDPRYICSTQSTRSELAIPLIVREEVVGVLDCQSDQLEYFERETIELLTLFSTQAAIALENARLYSLERERARQLEAINQIAQQSTAVLDVDELLNQTCAVIQRAFRVAHVCIFLREDADLVLRAHDGNLSPRFDVNVRFPIHYEPWCRVISSGRVLETNLGGDGDPKAIFDGSHSRLSIPLVSFGQALGVLTLHSCERNGFREIEVRSLESVADICANSIQNAHYVERVKQLAYLDGLTGIFNRRYFELRITEEIERARRYGTGMAIMMADIDDFKRLNDDFGHCVGDEVLRQISSIFQEQLRKVDVVCRYGGEEFAVLLPHAKAPEAVMIAEKLRCLVEQRRFPGVKRGVTISAGIAAFGSHGETRDEVLQAADRALYRAKQAGRNRVNAPEKASGASAG